MVPKSLREAVRICEKQHIGYVLDAYGWNKPKAAKHLEVGLSTLYRKIKELKIIEKR